MINLLKNKIYFYKYKDIIINYYYLFINFSRTIVA